MNQITVNETKLDVLSATLRADSVHYNICVSSEWTLQDVYKLKTYAFIFGDNIERKGKAGQACIRGLKNAYGVATKWGPRNSPGAFFMDTAFKQNCIFIDEDLSKIPTNCNVVWHEKIGLGLASLGRYAPETHKYLIQRLRGL